MRQTIVVLLSCTAMLLISSCGGSSSYKPRKDVKRVSTPTGEIVDVGDVGHFAGVLSRTLDDLPFEYSWDLELPAPVHMSWIQPSIPDTLFVQTKKRQIHAIEIKTGHTKWVSRQLPKLIKQQPQVVRTELPGRKKGEVIYDDRLYVVTDSILFCFDAVYGQLIWRYQMPFEPSTGPYALGFGKGLRVFIGDWQGHLRVVTYQEASQQAYVLWQWNLRGAALADPMAEGNLAYVSNDRGVLNCFDVDRELKWTYNMGSPMRGEPIVRGRSLYFGSSDNVFHVVNRLSGQVMGQLYFDAPIERSPFQFNFDRKRIYVWTEGAGKSQGLHAIDAVPDQIKYVDAIENQLPLEVERLSESWFVSGVSRIVGSSRHQLYVTHENDTVVYALNRKTGKAEWSWNMQAIDEDGLSIDFCSYIDSTGTNQSIITFDPMGKLTSYKLFGQMGRK
ncbi:MAG: PQQ-binding-like beta-propeller repeat protein [Planctomycetes bacterium]|nr:PQQ-binding-like beta-propeller repeat protein [Planctomycetota bacterium]